MMNTAAFFLGIQQHGHIAGSASAFLSILPFADGDPVAPLVSLAGDHAAAPMAIVIFCCSILAVFIFL